MTHEIAAQSPALAWILVAWILCGAGCVGLGLLWQRLWRDPRVGGDRLFMAFWSGLALAIGALQLWHFAWPVGPAAGALLLGVGLCGLVHQRAALGAARPRTVRQGLALAAAAAGVLYLAHRCLRPLEHYDTGLYLLGAMSWFRDAPLVPGLANLHGRFGFNNSHLLFAALFDVGPWTDRAPNLLNGCLVAVLLAQCLHAGLGVLGARSRRAGAAFAWLMIPPALMLSSRYLVSLSSDLPTTLLALVVAWRTFRVLAGEVSDAEARRAELRDSTLLAAACISIKLSALVFVAGVWLVAAAEHVRDARQRGAPLRRDALAVVAIAAALLLPWLARGVVLSGYPLYPSGAISLPVDWRVPAVSVENEALGVRSWARVPRVPRELTLNGWYWLDSWTRRNLVLRVGVGVPLPLLLGAAGVFLAALGGSLGQRSPATRSMWLLAPAASALVFWFWMAPDPRFAMFSLWSIAATGLGVAVGVWTGHSGGRVVGASVAAVAIGLSLASLPRDPIRAGLEGGFHQHPAVPTERFETSSGLVLSIPVGTDRCWRAARPCTPFRHADLRLRDPSDLYRGFARGRISPPSDRLAHLRD